MEYDNKIDIFVSVALRTVTVGLLYADWLSEPPQAFNAFFSLRSLLDSPIELTNGSIGSFEVAMDKLGPPHAARYRHPFSPIITTVNELGILRLDGQAFTFYCHYDIRP